jgi:hypothetical protein
LQSKLGEVAIPFDNLATVVRRQDPQAFQRMRFWVNPALGLAFDPPEPYWVNALAKHCLSEW